MDGRSPIARQRPASRRLPAVGAAFRPEIEKHICSHLEDLDALEIMLEHYLGADARSRHRIRDLAKVRPLVAHSIGLSVGSAMQPDARYVEQVAQSLVELNAAYYSEHLAFTRAAGIEFNELLPVPLTRDTARQIVQNVQFVRSFLDVPFYLENISYYFEYPDSHIAEADFFNLICRETGAGMLLDVENVHANALNHGLDPRNFMDSLDPDLVKAIHIAGGEWDKDVFVDNHGSSPSPGAFVALQYALDRFDPDVVIVERDMNLGRGDNLIADVRRVRAATETWSPLSAAAIPG